MIFVAAVIAQIATKKFNSWIYWFAIVASTTVGTTMADFFDGSIGIGYTGGTPILFICVLASLALWHFTLGSVNVETKVEIFYWVTITFSQTRGTALGDGMADDTGLGYAGGALVFGGALVILAALYYRTSVSLALLFWLPSS